MRSMKLGICWNYMDAYVEQIRCVMERLLTTGLDRHVMLLSKEEAAKYWETHK